MASWRPVDCPTIRKALAFVLSLALASPRLFGARENDKIRVRYEGEVVRCVDMPVAKKLGVVCAGRSAIVL